MKFKFLIFLVFILLVSSVSSQMISYEVIKGDKNIGSMNVLRLLGDSTESIEITSSVEFKLLLSFVVEYTLFEQFEKGVLRSGKGFNKINGSVQKDYSIEKQKVNYNLKFSEVPNTIHEKEIRYTVSQIYFLEPKNDQKVFSQHFARYLSFEKVGPGYYKLQSPDGINLYRYENGICTEVEVTRDFATVQFKLKPESYAIVNSKKDTLQNK